MHGLLHVSLMRHFIMLTLGALRQQERDEAEAAAELAILQQQQAEEEAAAEMVLLNKQRDEAEASADLARLGTIQYQCAHLKCR